MPDNTANPRRLVLFFIIVIGALSYGVAMMHYPKLYWAFAIALTMLGVGLFVLQIARAGMLILKAFRMKTAGDVFRCLGLAVLFVVLGVLGVLCLFIPLAGLLAH